MVRRILQLVAWTGFMISLAVHALTWVGVMAVDGRLFLATVALAVLLFLLPMTLVERVRVGPQLENPYLTFLMPDWMENVIAVVWMYAFTIALASLVIVLAGPTDLHEIFALRSYTAAGLFFFLTPALPFWYRRRKMKQEDILRELKR